MMIDDFDYIREKTNLEDMRNRISSLRVKLEEGRRLNEEKNRLMVKLEKATSVRDRLTVMQGVMQNLYEKTLSEDIAFKDRRLLYISHKITETLDRIFPVERFRVKLSCDYSRGMKASLSLFDRYGKPRIARISGGGMVQSTISYSGASSISKSLGANKLYLDEAFAVSSPTNLTKTGEITRDLVEEGMQIIMVEQYRNGYKDVPRREFHLRKDEVLDEAILTEVLDY